MDATDSGDQGELFDELDRIARMINISWHADVDPARRSMHLWDALLPHLARYPGTRVFQEWCTDYVLGACRRIGVITGPHTVSVMEGIYALRRVAPQVTVDVAVDYRRSRRVGHEEVDVDRGLATSIMRTIAGDEWDPNDSLGHQGVQRHLDKIAETAKRAHDVGEYRVAHRLSRPAHARIAWDEIRQLLEDLTAIYRFVAQLLDGVDTNTDIYDEAPRQLVTALSLYDHDAFMDALFETAQSLPAGNKLTVDELIEKTRAEYRFDIDGDVDA